VDISVIVCVCMVSDFSAKDKASGVKFFSEVHRRPRQSISHFCKFAPQKNKIRQIDECVGHAHPHLNITVEMRRCKRHARDAPFVKSRDV